MTNDNPIPTRIKQQIDSLPQNLFYPNSHRTTTTNRHSEDEKKLDFDEQPRRFVDALIRKQFSLKDETIELTFPEPDTIIAYDKEAQQVKVQQRVQEEQLEREKERQRRHIREEVRPKRLERRQMYDRASDRLDQLQSEILDRPPSTLLPKLYRRGVDSPMVVNMLHRFEREGSLVADLEKPFLSGVPQTTTLQQRVGPRRTENDLGDHIQLHLSIPDVRKLQMILQTEGFAGLNAALTEVNESKKVLMQEMEDKVRIRKLLFLMSLRKNPVLTTDNQGKLESYLRSAL